MASVLVVALLALPSSASAATYKIKAFSNDTFSPSVLTVNQGNLVKWINKGGYHDVDINKPSSYIATSPRATTGLIAQKTVVAGAFPFLCSVHLPGMTGKLKVKPTLSRSGSTVTVRLGPVESSFHHTIQRRRGSSGAWTSSTTTSGADTKAFTLASGTWQFRAKLVRTSNGTSSGYSPVVSISVP
ncbi:MAG: hypothetical protein H0U11_04765 [Chloroflexi bacterium]|nr:hypothetical protein [Chloroflexota bacterium]